MFEEGKGKHLSNRCAPIAAPHQQQQEHQPGLMSLTQLGAGMVSREARTLSCVAERITGEGGQYLGEKIHPVIGDIQAHPRVAAVLRPYEFRAALTTEGKQGLVHRKLPFAATSGTNSWLTSGQAAVLSLAEHVGRVTSDRNAGIYRYERLNLPSPARDSIPDVDELIDQLLAEYVVDRPDHPMLLRILGQSAGLPRVSSSPEADDTSVVGDDDEIY